MTGMKTSMQNFAINQALKYIEGDPRRHWKERQLVSADSENLWSGPRRKKSLFPELSVQCQLKRHLPPERDERNIRLQYSLGNPAWSHLRLQYALYRLLGGRIRKPAEPEPGNHRLHHPPGQRAGRLHVHLHRRGASGPQSRLDQNLWDAPGLRVSVIHKRHADRR